MLGIVGQLIKFLRVYRKFWLAPVILLMLTLGILLVLAESTAIAPFLYAIF